MEYEWNFKDGTYFGYHIFVNDDVSDDVNDDVNDDRIDFVNDDGNFFRRIKIDGVKDGLYRRWYENGQVEVERNFKDGKQNGYYRRWYGNDQLKVEGIYKNGKQEGIYREWHENGQIFVESNYKDGIWISSKYWDENGKEYEPAVNDFD